MSLSQHQRHQLHRIETGLLRGDRQLTSMLGIFGRRGQGADGRPDPADQS